jgi:hypothetical protein
MNGHRRHRDGGPTTESALQPFKTAKFGKSMLKLFALPAVLAVAGCISSSNPSPPAQGTTVVVPPGSTVVCPNGSPGPC